eukprot:scaffold6825_cov143-Pinguiococcus_pyrenoidosus.AAC.1
MAVGSSHIFAPKWGFEWRSSADLYLSSLRRSSESPQGASSLAVGARARARSDLGLRKRENGGCRKRRRHLSFLSGSLSRSAALFEASRNMQLSKSKASGRGHDSNDHAQLQAESGT